MIGVTALLIFHQFVRYFTDILKGLGTYLSAYGYICISKGLSA